MTRTLGLLILIAAVGLTLFCAKPETETAAVEEAAPLETGPDPTVVDADHYKTEFENERVRILRITYGPGETSVMHYHPDNVAFYLTDLHARMEMPDGSTEDLRAEAGQHTFAPAGQHLPTNIGEAPLELILVELKDAAAAPAMGQTGPDPTVVDAKHYKTEFENERVRILRIGYGAGEESVMHYHPEAVALFPDDHHAQFTMPDGSTTELKFDAGQHHFAPAGQHLPKNIGEEAWEVVLVELK